MVKNEGDLVEKGEAYVEIQTDKVNIEDEAETSGVIRKILAKEGDLVKVGKPIAIIASAHEDLKDIESLISEHVYDIDDLQVQVITKDLSLKQEEQVEGENLKIKASPAAKEWQGNTISIYQKSLQRS